MQRGILKINLCLASIEKLVVTGKLHTLSNDQYTFTIVTYKSMLHCVYFWLCSDYGNMEPVNASPGSCKVHGSIC